MSEVPANSPRFRLHVPGLIYVGLLVLVGVAAVNNQNNLLFWAFGMMLAGLIVSWVLSALMVHSLRVRRLAPQHGAVGEPLIMRYALTNRRRFLSIFNIHIEEREVAGPGKWGRLMSPARAWVMHVGVRETVHGEATFWPTRRGEAVFDRMRVWTTFPLGVVRQSITISQPQHTLIYPLTYQLRRGVLEAMTPKGVMGMRITQHAGAGDDYYGIREHRPGDSLRHIAWKRTARTDQLITIERTSPSPSRLRVVLDLTVRPSTGDDGRELEEKAISLAASIVRGADLAGFEVGLTVLGFGQPPIAVRRNQWHVRKMMAALASIDLDAPRSEQVPWPIRDVERAGLVVVSADRASTIVVPGREDVWYFTARQLESLTEGPIGWDPLSSWASPTTRAHHAAPEVAA